MGRRPDFLLIGAMKAGTSTLHDQLAAHPGFFLSTPKEPCFFSDDHVWARGIDWYEGLFESAAPDDLCGESSTHYTKRPTLDQTASRMHEALPDARLLYLMRHPVERLVSHYVHEWTEGKVTEPLDEAVATHPELVDYGRYAYQLAPYVEVFGHDRILPIFLERHIEDPARELMRIFRFIGRVVRVDSTVLGRHSNVSRERLRRSPVRDALLALPGATALRRAVLPERVRERIKSHWRMEARPRLSDAVLASVIARFDEDLAQLGDWLGLPLDCAGFRQQVCRGTPEWVPKG